MKKSFVYDGLKNKCAGVIDWSGLPAHLGARFMLQLHEHVFA